MTVYLPLVVFVIVLLFPFYWMGVTTFKPNDELYNYSDHNPFWVTSPTLANINKLLFETDYPRWLLNTMIVAFCATFLSLFASVLAAYAITRLRFRGAQTVGLLIFLAYLVPPSDSVHSAGYPGLRARHLTIPIWPLSSPIRRFSFRSAHGC